MIPPPLEKGIYDFYVTQCSRILCYLTCVTYVISLSFCALLAPNPGDATGNAQVKGRPYSITERRVPELISVLGSQPAGDVSHKPGGRLPLLSARPAVTPRNS